MPCQLLPTITCTHNYIHTYRVVMGDINPRDNEGMTPLHCAAHFCRPRHIELLHEGARDNSILLEC